MGIRTAWEHCLKSGTHERDDAQEALVAKLDDLQRRLVAAESRRISMLVRWRARSVPPVRGLYIWGGVGGGKTFLMDLFFATLPVKQKKRIHFHHIMRDVHARLAGLHDVADPLKRVAAEMARDISVLCFDEFYVNDIGDAMILAGLLQGLFENNVTLIATSNSQPDDLYKDGLQRSRFLPAIELLNTHTTVVELDTGTDYRMRMLEKAGTWLTPDDAAADARLAQLFRESAASQVQSATDLDVNGRPIRVRKRAESIAWFDFDALCEGPRSQTDYIEIARWFPTVLLSGVPQFAATDGDPVRRFIALVDEFYDRQVKLVASAACDVADLYPGTQHAFEFERTKSRLIEMQSNDYLALEHLA
ncbi:MAG TPA: cell division protein ZapE [Woeseiaceae bacterium]|nr:cell division protein ZapE [Woeseiaceae bacterium]